MAARSIWTGTLNVGIVSLGIKVYKATDEASAETSMKMLHSICMMPINEKKICTTCNTDVVTTEVVKGVQVAPGKFVVMTKEDIDAIKPKSSETIAVESFVDATIDPLYIASSYFIAPDKGATPAYVLLHAAMVSRNKVMQARMTIYGREHIVIVRPMGSGLVLQLMRSKNEVRDMSELPTYIAPGAVKVDAAQLALAGQLVDVMDGTFDPTEYEDEYVKEFKALVQAKVDGTEPIVKNAAPTAQPADLLAALKASLKGTKKPVKVAKASKKKTA